MKEQNFSNFFITSKSRSSLTQVGCVRGADTLPNHNQSFTREYLIRPVHPGFLVTLNEILGGNSQQSSKHNENHQRTPRGDVRQKQTKYITLYSTLQIRHLNQDFKARGLLNLTSMQTLAKLSQVLYRVALSILIYVPTYHQFRLGLFYHINCRNSNLSLCVINNNFFYN